MSKVTLEIFAVEVKKHIKEILGDGYNTEIRTVSKNNGIILTGISISRIGDSVSPLFYLNDSYTQMEDIKTDAEDVARKIVNCFRGHGNLPAATHLSVNVLHDFEQVKGKVMFKLINTRSNECLLRQVPNMPYLDLSIVFYLYMGEDEEGMMTAQLNNEHFALWEVDVQTLYRNALQNMQRVMPAVIKSMKEIMNSLRMVCEEESNEDEREEATPFHVLTTASGINGAVCMLYPGVLAGFAEQRGKDIIIIPSSVHELLLMEDVEGMDYKELVDLVRLINATEVAHEDVLSGNIYRYERYCGKVSMINIDEIL